VNRLAGEKSPYLLQHKDNPVDWYPWGDEAFATAAGENKPVFLSIGYATCHWCHVMEHESFEDEEVAALLNEHYIPIKVDREERPDVDHIYMTACQLVTGQGGWPLTAILTPDRKPFFVGTYFPKHGRGNRPGMVELLPAIAQAWEARVEEVTDSALELSMALTRAFEVPAAQTVASKEVLQRAVEQLAEDFDPEYGGFGRAPKFPSPHTLLFLLRQADRTGDRHALEMVARTLDNMRMGGVFDQVGFGFHRYSTDREWRVPHFEKMLYDQAMMTLALTECARISGRPRFERYAREVLEYVRRDLTSGDGLFFSAEDADSEGEEGTFYVWTSEELEHVLGKDEGAWMAARLDIRDGGNYLDEATRQRTGKSIPIRTFSDEDIDHERFDRNRRQLLNARSQRVRPLLDDKILTDWNGLMIAALARAGRVFGDGELIRQAEQSAERLIDVMVVGDKLMHRYRDGETAISALLDDYACLAWAFVELYDATLDVRWLEGAVTRANEVIDRFGDPEGGFFMTTGVESDLLVRPAEFTDGAAPSGNSVALLALSRLWRLTAERRFADVVERGLRRTRALVERAPRALAANLLTLDAWLHPGDDIVIAAPDPQSAQPFMEMLRPFDRSRRSVMLKTPENTAALRHLAFHADAYAIPDTGALAYVCHDFACDRPVDSVDALSDALLDALER
jgi:uncharacterized protein